MTRIKLIERDEDGEEFTFKTMKEAIYWLAEFVDMDVEQCS